MILPLTSLTQAQLAHITQSALGRGQSNAEYALALFKRALERDMKPPRAEGRMSFNMVEDE